MVQHSDILDAALKEEAELLRQLENTVEFQKLEAIRRVIRAYRGNDADGAPKPETRVRRRILRRTPLVRAKPQKGSAIEETADAAERILRKAGRPVSRGELYKILVAQGIAIGGKNPRNALATRLYHSGRFQTIEGQGYVLKAGHGKESKAASE